MSAQPLDPIWDIAHPLAERLYQVTECAGFLEHRDMRAHLRRAMGSAVSCLRDAQAQLGSRMTCAYLAGAERMIHQVMDDLKASFADGYLTESDFHHFCKDGHSLAEKIHDVLLHLPEGSRNTVVMNDYASLYLPPEERRFA